ncbi:muts protein 1 [Podospora fimiseda]|uniref:Muts protein 1 n=1 Tax=Podospora fimiseda TaxID=252190 RepID=A0AAN7H212_9PEZI|nr:muts protein 1 [Podospora fimiseda]
MLSPRLPPVPRLRIACLGQTLNTPRALPHSIPATVGRCGVRYVTTGGPGVLMRQRQTQVRGKKTTTVVKLDDLPQGLIAPLEPLAPEPRDEDEEPAYPTVVLQARRNMQKFDNCVLLTRVGGFYEIYLDQANEYGPLLNIKVAQRKTSAGPISMAGFPFFQLDRFLKILVQDLNRHVAIAEEFPNDPSERIRAGGLMHTRRVARIVTPGTLIDENFMDPYANNYIMAIHLPETSVSDDSTRQEAQQAIDTSQPANLAANQIGLAWLDLSTGNFFTQPTTLESLGSVLSRISPREIVLDKALELKEDHAISSILQEERYLVSYCPKGELKKLEEWIPMLEGKIPVKTAKKFTDNEVDAGCLLLHYVRGRLQGLSMKLQPPRRYENMEVMNIDKNSMRSLEIKQTIRDGVFKGSLLHTIRRTVTKSGARLLNDWLTFPSTSLEVINFRQELVARFIQDDDLGDAICTLLRRSHDSQRLVQRFALNRGDADDLLRLANTIKATEDIVTLLQAAIKSRPKKQDGNDKEEPEKDCLEEMIDRINLKQPLKLARAIRDAIDEEGLVQQHQLEDSETGEMIALAQEIVKAEGTDEDGLIIPKKAAPLAASIKAKKPITGPGSWREIYGEDNELWTMKPGASSPLTRLHAQLKTTKEEKEKLTETLRTRFNASSLTLRWSSGLGHICHVKGKDAKSLPSPEEADTDPSLSGMRTLAASKTTRTFHLPEWTTLGEHLDKLRVQIRAEEQRVFASLRSSVVLNLVRLRRNAAVLDELDVVTSFSRLAVEQNLVRPVLNTATGTTIIGGRHPTVESGLADQGRTFQKNDLILSSSNQKDSTGRIWLITGPNMAGKSTFLRQNALITILAQIGCYVPADYAELGMVDAIFSRVGSADNLFQDQSTFMVEMIETAAILRQASHRSFVIMDEVGRGTTPEDGTAVAFASLNHLVRVNKCRGLFATHFHGISDLVKEQGMRVEDGGPDGAIDMYCTDVEEDDRGGFVYVHKLRKGTNRQSHALKVAKLAGLPEQAIRVAQEVLAKSGHHY